jgi:hypothetical protein
MSFFVKVKDTRGRERTLWGVGLRDAITESGARKGDRITAQVTCGGDVVVDGKTATRNAWEIAVVHRAQTIEQAAPVVERAVSASVRSVGGGIGLGM